jgi:hypothetical protein
MLSDPLFLSSDRSLDWLRDKDMAQENEKERKNSRVCSSNLPSNRNKKNQNRVAGIYQHQVNGVGV